MSYGSKQWREWVLEEEDSRPIVRRALEAGITFFDTADMYSLGVSEEIVGRALKDFADGRDRVVVATKVYMPMSNDPNDRGLSRKHILESIDKSLNRLGTDYVDLYQIHRFDYETPMEETLRALEDVVRAGKARYIGASAMWAWQFMKMQMTADQLGVTRFTSMQCYYNILYREQEREMLPLCVEEGVAVIPYSPLARGFVTGKYKRGGRGETIRSQVDEYTDRDYYNDQDFDIVDRITEVAQRQGVKNTQVALAWMMQKQIAAKNVVTAPIFSATKSEHIDDAVAALDVKLSAEDMAYLEQLYRPRKILGHN